jgi:hypothetical protein
MRFEYAYQSAFGMMSVPARNSNKGIGTKLAATLETFIVEAARWHDMGCEKHKPLDKSNEPPKDSCLAIFG